MVSGTMALTGATFSEGSAAIVTQRGSDTWGANYVFNPDGLQNDIQVVADNLSQGGIVASGTQYVGSADTPVASSGLFINADDGTSMRLVVYANGLVSGVLA